jgi:hypothetical protein
MDGSLENSAAILLPSMSKLEKVNEADRSVVSSRVVPDPRYQTR